MSVSADRLKAIYSDSDDPWQMATSSYEQEKFRATRQSLPRDRYRSALEIGCGNGELARHLASVCDRYTGIDSVERAVAAARRAVPHATFVVGHFPCDLPPGDHELIVISEFLYFLGKDDIAALGHQIGRRWSMSDLLCVTYLGDTEHELSGPDAYDLFAMSLTPTHRFCTTRQTENYRINLGQPKEKP